MTTRISITRDRRIVKVSGTYPEDISEAYRILGEFRQVELGSTWGLDGIAEYVAQKNGCFCLNKSGISKRQAAQFLKTGRAQEIE